ncbi:MAG: hypothetical protein RR716_03550, partial [Christensenellaceae bacterium]
MRDNKIKKQSRRHKNKAQTKIVAFLLALLIIFTGMPTAMAADFPTSSPTPTSTDSESKLDMPLQIERVLKLEPIEGESTDSTKSADSTDTTEKNPAAPTSTTSRTYSQPATLNLT